MTTKEATVNGGWGRGVPSGRLPRGVQIIIKRSDEGHDWTTLLNGRVLAKGWAGGAKVEARNDARRSLEACGLMTDGE